MTAAYIDSHQHFWQLSRGDYHWLTPELGPVYRDFTPQDLRPLLVDANVGKTIVVQAAPTVAETQYLLTLAESTDFIAGVIGWVDMEAPDVSATLQRLADNPYLKGIRPMIQDIADPEWMLKPELARAFQQLIDHGLCFDALVLPVHLPHLLTLLERYPELNTVVDHGAKPAIAGTDNRKAGAAQWADNIAAIAQHSRACCKLSGLLTEADEGAGLTELQPYMQHLLDSFGPARLMWGSDWPVLTMADSYRSWLSMTRRFLSDLGEADRALIMGANAACFYQLNG